MSNDPVLRFFETAILASAIVIASVIGLSFLGTALLFLTAIGT